jgi:glc operon protein GlcG
LDDNVTLINIEGRQPIFTRFALSLTEAETMVRAAQARALQNGWHVTVAIVDDSGTPLLVSRLDESSPASVQTAIDKAACAALTGLPTKAIESMVGARPALVTLNRVAVEGGLPILHRGQRVGGIGVSGVRSEQDSEIAQAGLDALAATNPTS